jgi:hypothetical protein
MSAPEHADAPPTRESAAQPQQGNARDRAERSGQPISLSASMQRYQVFLAECYPVVMRLVGPESFQAAAHRFLGLQAPHANAYTRFPQFLRGFGPPGAADYLADIAKLELAYWQALMAPRAVPLRHNIPCSLPNRTANHLHLVLHPSVKLVASRFPIVSIWEANRDRGAEPVIPTWRGEAGIVTRPGSRIEVRRLPVGGYTLLSAICEGASLGNAIAAAQHCAGGCDLEANLELLCNARIVTAITAGPLARVS